MVETVRFNAPLSTGRTWVEAAGIDRHALFSCAFFDATANEYEISTEAFFNRGYWSEAWLFSMWYGAGSGVGPEVDVDEWGLE